MVDIVNLLFTNINLDEELHCIDDIILNKSEVFYIIRVIELLVELVATNTSEVITALREEERVEVFFSLLNCHWLTWLQNCIYSSETIFFSWFVIYRTFFYEFNFLAFETVDNHL